jgi:hypothetical protein
VAGIRWEWLPNELGFGDHRADQLLGDRGYEHDSHRQLVRKKGVTRSSRAAARDDIHEAFIKLGCALICWRRLRTDLRTKSFLQKHGRRPPGNRTTSLSLCVS